MGNNIHRILQMAFPYAYKRNKGKDSLNPHWKHPIRIHLADLGEEAGNQRVASLVSLTRITDVDHQDEDGKRRERLP